MKGRFLGVIAALVLGMASMPARAYLTLDAVVPDSPVAGEIVSARISDGFCDVYVEHEGYPQITQTGNTVRMVIYTLQFDDPILCITEPATGDTPIGAFPPGSYTFQLDRYIVPMLGPHYIETVGTRTFVVSGPPSAPTALPALSLGSLFVMVLSVLAMVRIAFTRRRATGLAVLLVLVGFQPRAEAQVDPLPDRYVQVLLSSDAAAPLPEEIVNYFSFSPPAGSPPLAAFKTVAPVAAGYLLPLRATGDFLAYLEANPETARAQLERYLLIAYSPDTDIETALSSLLADTHVLAASLPLESEFSGVSLVGFDLEEPGAGVAQPLGPLSTPTQYGWDALNLSAAWQLASGYALIGAVDSGLAVNHPALRQFSPTGQYLGGNFIPAASLDIGDWPTALDADVNEVSLMPLGVNSPCNVKSIPDLSVEPYNAGHGTHVSGLLAANSTSGLSVKGTCRNCGIAMWKVARNQCAVNSRRVELRLNADATPPAITFLADTGAQVINLSLGNAPTTVNFCATYPDDPYCKALTHAANRGVVVVSSSGNHRTRLQFPARDSRVIPVGGFDGNIALWDESPGSTTFCPNPTSSNECGSNYTTVAGEPRQELMAASKAVFSTTYPGKDWSVTLGCGDSFGTAAGDGLGLCTGTSMSAPQVSGVVGILRSINPLVGVGKPVLGFVDVPGIRSVLAQTTVEAQSALPWTQTFGHGRPDAAAAATRMLGKVQGRTVKNRVTPLFRLYGSGSKDYADTTTPQTAIALAINQNGAYVPQGAVVPGYPSFPSDPGANTPMPTPRAPVYVLTTEYKPRPEWPALVPLYQMDRGRNFPLGCAAGAPGCNNFNRDYMLVTTTAHIEQAHNDGYNLRTIQGYIYQPCSGEPACIPPGAQKFYRACKTADDDCATFLESERVTFETAGYTTAYPAGSNKVLGYAYPPTDTDGDGLVDGFEYVIGTKPTVADSDGDGVSDGVEFPMAGVPVSDPCSGSGGRNCPAEVIFQNGFQ
jgi:hypothetical protein